MSYLLISSGEALEKETGSTPPGAEPVSFSLISLSQETNDFEILFTLFLRRHFSYRYAAQLFLFPSSLQAMRRLYRHGGTSRSISC
jgi:hypothetical protein